MYRAEDQIRRLAALTGVILLTAAEALAQDRQAGPARRIVVSIPDRKLAVVEAGQVLRIFQTAVGASATPSPTGNFRIVERLTNPAWYHKGRVIPPGKSNPLGPRWLGLSQKGYGIHGTNAPASIGRSASHGCIRLRNSDIEALFEMVAVGDEVDFYGERTPELEQIFGHTLTAQAARETN